jgi:putative FmdB family regulatory protein
VPLYEYECHSCGHRFEMLQKVADSPLTSCVKCEGKVERLLSSPAIQFKGTGWYVTDYARKGQAPATKGAEGTSKPNKSENNRSKSGPAASASSTSKD